MKNILVLVLLITCLKISAQQIKPSYLRAKLESTLTLKTKCSDDKKYEYVYIFRVIEFNVKNSAATIVGIVISCPEKYGEGYFQKNRIYEMKVVSEERETYGNLLFDSNSKNVQFNGLYFLKDNSIEML